jgi:hypothetical protein
MSAEPTHPAARYERDMRSVKTRARLAVGALGLTIGVHTLRAGVHLWRLRLIADLRSDHPPSPEAITLNDALVQGTDSALLPLLVLTGIVFLMWLHQAVRLTRSLGGARLEWSPSEAVTGFFIPFLSFVRPYQVVRDLHDQLAPEIIPEPVAKVHAGEGGYRDVRIDVPPPAMKVPHASIGVWWTLFWIGRGLASLGSALVVGSAHGDDALRSQSVVRLVYDSVSIAAAVLAIVVVSAITARLVERFRRVRHIAPEDLVDQGIYVVT